MSIVHSTPGLLDIRSITTFGLIAKPGSDNPIVKFGTGLKYAIATLLRNDCKIKLFIGEVEYEFFTKQDNFRGMEFHQVFMRKRKGLLAKWTSVELPFTTLHGKYWQVWQAFRELHSNTLDESGRTFESDVESWAVPYDTNFVIDGTAYSLAFAEKSKTFLPNALTVREGDDRVQVFNEPSNHLYWRGIRVFDLEKPSVYTYNILEDMELTEDRTLKYVWQAQAKIASYVARSKDQKLINAIVSADAEKFFEGRLDWDYAYTTPSAEFKEVVAKKKSRGSYLAPRALAFYDKYAPAPVIKSERTLSEKLQLWAYDTTVHEELRELLTYLLRCKIEEPSTDADEFPF
jgi:hypothetical protein